MVTIIILVFTCAVSLITLQNQAFKQRFMFNAYAIKHRREWWRWFTGAFLHADGFHLLFNMVTLYSFGPVLEKVLNEPEFFSHGKGSLMFFLLYASAIPVSAAYTYFKHKDNPHYNGLGASGAVCAILFAYILLFPTAKLGIMGIIPVTAWIYAIIYLVISGFMYRKNLLNWAHDVHIVGSIYGLGFMLAFFPFLGEHFIATVIGSYVN